MTTQIVQLLTGDQEFDSPKTLAAFALGLVLFLVTLALNIVALRVVKKYRSFQEDVALPIDPTPTDWAGEEMRRRIRRRYGAERRFRLLGLAAILISAASSPSCW